MMDGLGNPQPRTLKSLPNWNHIEIAAAESHVGLQKPVICRHPVRMSIEEIEQRIPHRPPMRLLDEIVSQTESSIVCKKTFSASEFFVQGHFPDQPIVPGVIQCECCLQAGAVLLSRHAAGTTGGDGPGDNDSNGDGSVPVATRMDGVKFKRMVRPGDTVEIHATLNESISNAFYLTGKILLHGKVAMRLDFSCSVTNPGKAASEQQ